MSIDEARKRLAEAGYRIDREERPGNDTGTQLRLDCGAVVNVFDNGTVSCQGKNRESVEALFKGESSTIGPPVVSAANAKVFVVYGHDSVARDQLEVMLRRWGLEPHEKYYRARQNVVLELGMLLSKLGRRRVAILLKQQERMERPSDIQGLIYIPFKDDVKDAGVLLAKEMAAQGYKIDIQKL